MKNYTREDIQNIFQAKFDIEKWQRFIVDFFKADEVKKVGEQIDVKEGEGRLLGYMDTADDYRLSFFYVRLDRSIDKRKVGLRQLITPYIKIDSDGGIGVFDDGNHWRLSFITDLKGEKTSPKRFTFVFGEDDTQYRTAVDRFMELQKRGISFANIRETFSVEALTKQFYNDLFDWYSWALKDDTGVYFPNNPNTPEDDRENLDTKIIRLITRLMFVWFIKQKGLVLDALFNPDEIEHWLKDFDPQSMTSSNYYQAILQNLFFATLNRPIRNVTYDKNGNEVVERRCFATLKDHADVKSKYRYTELFKISEDKILSIFEFIPFINGGLFECLDKNKTSDGTEYAYFDDGFSRNANRDSKTGRWSHRAFVPNKLFFDPNDGIISIFNRYNFTVEENTPLEQQIALDPELLGKVFENLLGAYNPETHDNATARNQSGSFYTPREIVNYMIDISLQAYLGNSDEVKALFADDFVYDDSKKGFYDEVIEKLKSIKVLDPACGSGAFPIGMLNRVVDLMERLNAPGSKYDLKLQIMENCIYGGDIQTIAAQITKLRFFISLVCDCKKSNKPEENYGIPNLPNLETHFVTCDSLIELECSKKLREDEGRDQSIFAVDVNALKNKLKDVRHDHFMAKTVYRKNQLRNQDEKLRGELIEMLSDDNVIDSNEDAKKMAAWNPYDQNGKAEFFDPDWMFGIKDGFDVVIGNPPYIQLQANKGELAKKYEKCGFKTFTRMGDIYCLFYECGAKFLNEGGALCYITSNKWMRAGYGENLRNYLTAKTNPGLLIDFGETHVFESATVMTNILLFRNGMNVFDLKSTQIKEDFTASSNINNYVDENHIICKFEGSESWTIMPDSIRMIKKKVEAQGKPLKDWNVEIFRGILTGYNPAFIITTEQRNSILAACSGKEERKATEDIIRPVLRGKDILKYNCKWVNLWLIYLPWHFPLHLDNSIEGSSEKAEKELQSQYPSLYSYITSHKEKLSKRNQAETGIRYEWYALQRWGANYWQEFDKPKIVYPNMTKYMPFYYDEEKFLTNQKCFIITGNHMSYLTAFFNSSLFKFCFFDDFPVLFGGARELSKIFFEKIPVKKVDDATDAEFRTLVLDIQKEYSDKKAKAIDEKIFDLYGLTKEERETIGYIDYHNAGDDADEEE